MDPIFCLLFILAFNPAYGHANTIYSWPPVFLMKTRSFIRDMEIIAKNEVSYAE